MMSTFDPTIADDLNVPDPYYGGIEGFNEVYDMLHRAANGFLDHVLEQEKKS